MNWYALSQWMPELIGLAFIVAVGACIGSLTNVLVYRIPLGLGVVTPSSRCPSCGTRLTWRENIPVLGWLLLRGRCRFCNAKISPEYPIVEAVVALLFGGIYALWFLLPQTSLLGVDWARMQPEWAENGIAMTWPVLVVVLLNVSCLVAMTLIDAKTFTIPLPIAWAATIGAVILLPAHAAWLSIDHGALGVAGGGHVLRFADGVRWDSAAGWMWTLPTAPRTPFPGAGWGWIGGSIGCVVGLGVSVLLVKFGLIGQSFADYEEWEREALAKEKAEGSETPEGEGDGERSEDGGPEIWVQYPHARREMVKEMAFLGPPAVLAWLGWWGFGEAFGSGSAPLWLVVLGGSLVGYLIGGGVVWAVRILGSLLFGKEAMGIGDVHLLAAAGACFGWIDVLIGFFAAAFVGLAWAVAGVFSGGRIRRAMPYGPFLAAGTLLVVLFKPVIELWLTTAVGGSAGPIDLP